MDEGVSFVGNGHCDKTPSTLVPLSRALLVRVQDISLPKFALGIMRARGDFNKANLQFGRELGARPTNVIVDDLRSNAEAAPVFDLLLLATGRKSAGDLA